MRLIHILTELWTQPALILPEVHKQICKIVEAHMTGAAHAPEGIALTAPDGATPPTWSKVGNVGVVPIKGVLDKRVSTMERSSGGMGLDDIEGSLAEALLDSDVEGILLDVDSPGGSTTGVPELAAKIRAAAVQKPVVAYTDSLMASAAYWLASGATAIYAAQSAMVGSIGVYMAWKDTSRANELAGIKTELIKVGKYKAAGVDGIELTDEQRARFQERVDTVAGWFKGAVNKARDGIRAEAMEGQTFFGDEAVAENLVDAVGTIDDAMVELNEFIAERKGE